MEVEDEGADQHEPQDPQRRRCGAGAARAARAGTRRSGRCRSSASTPRYILRLPIMWTRTKPMPMMPVIAITYFLPTAVRVEVEQERLALLPLWTRCRVTGPRVTACAMRRTLMPHPAGDRNARAISASPRRACGPTGRACRERSSPPSSSWPSASTGPSTTHQLRRLGRVGQGPADGRAGRLAGAASSRGVAVLGAVRTRGGAGCGSGSLALDGRGWVSHEAAAALYGWPRRSGRARSSSPCRARRGGCAAPRRSTPPTTSVPATSAPCRGCAARRRSARS